MTILILSFGVRDNYAFAIKYQVMRLFRQELYHFTKAKLVKMLFTQIKIKLQLCIYLWRPIFANPQHT